MLSIEIKEDSSEKLAAIAGKPEKHYLFAAEFNQVVEAINALSENPAFSEFITYLPPEIVGTDFLAPANQQWKIKGISYTNAEAVEHTITLAASGLKKFVLFASNKDNTIEMFDGPESANPQVPSLPTDTLFYAMYLVTDSLVGEEIPPVLGNNYQTKTEKGDAICAPGSFEYIGGTEASYCRIISLTSGILKSISVVSGNTYVNPGKEYTIKNELVTPLTLKHQDSTLTASNYKKFWFANGLDLVLQPGESATVHYSQNRFELVCINRIISQPKRTFVVVTPAFQFINLSSGNWFGKPVFNTSYLTINTDKSTTDHTAITPNTTDFLVPFNCKLKSVSISMGPGVDFSVSIRKSDDYSNLNGQEIYYKATATAGYSEIVSSAITIPFGGGVSIFLKQLGTLTSSTKYGKMTLTFEEA